MKKCRRNRREPSRLPVCAIAFGAGLFVALFCSVRLVLLLLALFLIYVGINWYSWY